jgi:CysZ protein
MKFFLDFFKAIANCFNAFSILFQKGLWPFLIYPLIIWIMLWVASLYGFLSLAKYISNYLSAYINAEAIPQTGHWLSFARPLLIGKIGFIISWVLKIIFWFISGTFVKYLLLMVLSPVFALLSEKTDEKLTGTNVPFNLKQLFKDVFRGVIISLRNMILEYFFIFICFMLNLFFPPSFFITTPFLFLIGWYFVGFALLDYNCERYKFGISKSLKFIKQNKGYACGIGFVYSFFMALPFFIGTVVGIMFGPAIAVIGATLCFLQLVPVKSND